MKNLKYNLGVFLSLALLFTNCQDDDFSVGDIIAPSNIQIAIAYIDDGVETSAPGLGSGLVRFSATAMDATAFHFVIQNGTKLQANGAVEHNFTTLGNNTYAVTVVAYGTGGISTTKTIEVDVLALYEPPADLVEMLHANSSRTWKIASEVDKHFGLGSIGGPDFEYYGAAPGDKAHVGMYDDRYVFNVDGTFTHITDNTNDDPAVNIAGTVFGREVLIEELNGPGGEVEGADIIQYPYSDYSEQYTLTAPGGEETISLTGLGFVGYYVGGNHKYVIYSRSADEMVIKTTDGNGQFDWWFRLVPE